MFDSVLNVTLDKVGFVLPCKDYLIEILKITPCLCMLQITVIIMTDDSDPDLRLIKLVLMHSLLHRED